MQKFNIVIDCQPLQTNSYKQGIGRYTIGFLSALSKINIFNLTLIINGYKKGFKDVLKTNSIDLKNIKVETIYPISQIDYHNSVNNTYLDNQFIYYKIVERNKPNFFIVPSMMEIMYGEFVTPPIEWINNICTTSIIAHDLFPYEEIDYYLKDNALRLSYQLCLLRYNLASLILCNSEYTKSSLLNYNPGLQCEVLKGGIVENFALATSTKKESFFLYAGGTSKRKNVDFLIQEYLSLPLEVRLKHKLIIVSGNNSREYKRLKNLTKSFSEIDILFYVDEAYLKKLYSTCSLFIFSSLKEGLGLSVLEALSCGAPTLVANNSSMKEIYNYPHFRFEVKKGELTKLILKVLCNDKDLKALNKISSLYKRKYQWKFQSENIKNIISRNLSFKEQLLSMDFSKLGLRKRTDKDQILVSKLLIDNFLPNIYILCPSNNIEEVNELFDHLQSLYTKFESQKFQNAFLPNVIPIFFDPLSQEFIPIVHKNPLSSNQAINFNPKNKDILITLRSTKNGKNNFKDFSFLSLCGLQIKLIDTYKEIYPVFKNLNLNSNYLKYFNRIARSLRV